jgi:hypothetical protein
MRAFGNPALLRIYDLIVAAVNRAVHYRPRTLSKLGDVMQRARFACSSRAGTIPREDIFFVRDRIVRKMNHGPPVMYEMQQVAINPILNRCSTLAVDHICTVQETVLFHFFQVSVRETRIGGVSRAS